ncbi:oligoendopeptidase F [Holzapfeliella sp. He02]|uniref:Oligopeptidase F n=1 Tax=Holzapfeliella saturejae TaxID=3082953 RepID=A0ABU8SEW2_9LACO
MSIKNANLNRQDVDINYTYDLSDLCENNTDFLNQTEALLTQVSQFSEQYGNRSLNMDEIKTALSDYNDLWYRADILLNYAFLNQSVDLSNTENNEIAFRGDQIEAELTTRLQFFEDLLLKLPNENFKKLMVESPQFKGFLRNLKQKQKIAPNKKVEQTLNKLMPVLQGPSRLYGQVIGADLTFEDFIVNGKTYPLSFSLYEDYYAFHHDTEVRRGAFDAFSKQLKNYQDTLAANYLNKVTSEKILADLYGFDSVIDYLLYNQEVSREMFDRQINLIMKKFGPIVQKYLRFLKDEHHLDQLTFADRLIDIDFDYAPKVSIDDSKDYIKNALEPLGSDYQQLILKGFDERWVDFTANKGKETGAFCAQPYQKKPKILLSWQNTLSDVYTLIHELGHAGQGILSSENHTYLDFNPSTYIVETASTFNELLLTDYLSRTSQTKQQKRFALGKLFNNTYFHNFVTHLLEAAFQQKVYQLVDEGKSFNAEVLNQIKLDVLKKFYGDSLSYNEGAELTWMRQSHYYMGLYSYTYSASLTISTQEFLKFKENPAEERQKWLDFLAIGNSLSPIDSAKKLDIDITTSQPLENTIDYFEKVVDEIIDLSN